MPVTPVENAEPAGSVVRVAYSAAIGKFDRRYVRLHVPTVHVRTTNDEPSTV